MHLNELLHHKTNIILEIASLYGHPLTTILSNALFKMNKFRSNYSKGVKCGDGRCIQEASWCDGVCDCEETCDDEEECEKWNCDENTFKCNVSGICIGTHMICDGYNDCGVNDRYFFRVSQNNICG